MATGCLMCSCCSTQGSQLHVMASETAVLSDHVDGGCAREGNSTAVEAKIIERLLPLPGVVLRLTGQGAHRESGR
jgi:hypothetical protein